MPQASVNDRGNKDAATAGHCSEHGVGETNASLTLAGGTTVTRTIGCTAAKVASVLASIEVAEATKAADEPKRIKPIRMTRTTIRTRTPRTKQKDDESEDD